MTDLPYSKRVLELADKWIKGSITETEKQEFIDWYQRFDDQELLLTPEFEPVIKELETGMLATIRQRISGDGSPPVQREKGLLRRIGGWKLSAAAAVIVMALLIPMLLTRKSPLQAPIALQKPASTAPTDVLPGSNKAILTLANGSTITLDNAHNGNLAKQGNTQVVKSADGALQYKMLAGNGQSNQKESNTVAYNILSTPRGGQYRLVLPDGSKVWLNAASSIRYPTAFNKTPGATREVEITGEAYFEIAKNAAMPFRVLSANQLGDANPMVIDVLGTHFNINAYSDETAVRTSLLEGAVKVSKGKNTALLQPGMEAQLSKDGAIRSIPGADVEKAAAWKDGVFEFGDEELPVIMRQIARWYDVDVVYEGPVPTDRFTGRVSRNTSLSGVLKILKLSDVQVTISNNKIIVK
ncbi:FecR family protein [Puia dinghuensis]|uniref:Iron dicitrate transporter FecR n=1 Tax=Puia dinghuensis TaxID=1792502 RepID=A0A8J2XSU6_9BACT|nr:FecR family protein [Puia dinghuensis]GGA98719.1 iron dicitrate transporter FecR [Puia dinghuensis]